MKRLLVICALFFISTEGFSQYKEQWRVLHGYEMSANDGIFGLGFAAEYFPVNYFSIIPQFTFFIPEFGNARAFDINARYYFTEKEKQWYGLMGYGHYTRVFEFNDMEKVRFNSLNIGGGGMIKLNDEIGLNPEIRYQVGRNDLVFRLSILYFVN